MIAAASTKNLFSLTIVTIERHFYISDPFLNLSFGKESFEIVNFEGLVKVWIVFLRNSLKTCYFMSMKESWRKCLSAPLCLIFSLAAQSSTCLDSLCFCWIKVYKDFFFGSKENWPNIFWYVLSYQISSYAMSYLLGIKKH